MPGDGDARRRCRGAQRFEGEAGGDRRDVRRRRRSACSATAAGRRRRRQRGGLGKGRRRAHRAAADLGRDERRGRPFARVAAAAQPAARFAGGGRAARLAASTSTAPSCPKSRSRRSTAVTIAGAPDGTDAAWASAGRGDRGPRPDAHARRRAAQHHLPGELRRHACRRTSKASGSRSPCSARRRWQSSAWARCSASRRARCAKARLLALKWNGEGRAIPTLALGRQGRDLRHRRHLASSPAPAWKT